MKLLVFGSGFIAENFITYWQGKHHNAEIVVLFNHHKVSNKDVTHYDMNTINMSELLIEFSPEYIICFQGNSFVSDNVHIKNAIENNVMKTSELLEVINDNIKLKVKKILLIGSAGEYGKLYDEPIDENKDLKPNSLYGLSKTILYEISKYYCRQNLPIVYVRQFNTVGVGQQEKFVLPSFIKQVVRIEKKLQKNTIDVGDLSQERDFIDIKDTCKAYDLLLGKGAVSEVYNVASGKYISIEELLNKIVSIANLDINDIVIQSNKNKFINSRLSKRLYANISKLEALGFTCTYTIEDTIKEVLKFWRNNV